MRSINSRLPRFPLGATLWKSKFNNDFCESGNLRGLLGPNEFCAWSITEWQDLHNRLELTDFLKSVWEKEHVWSSMLQYPSMPRCVEDLQKQVQQESNDKLLFQTTQHAHGKNFNVL